MRYLEKYLSSENSSKMDWSENEKRDLLVALETHGPNNLEEIHKYLPSRSVTEIRSMIQKYKEMAQNQTDPSQNKEDEVPLNQWIKVMKSLKTKNNDVEDLYSRLFKYIAYFGNFTDDSGVNLRDCYYTISELMKGESVKNLDPHTSYFLNKCLSDLAHKVDSSDNTEKFEFLDNIKNIDDLRKNLVRSYSKKQEGYSNNPLKVPDSLLKMKPADQKPSTSYNS